MSDKTFTLKRNAVRAARKLIADGKASAPTFQIKTATGRGFRIVWDTPAAVERAAEAMTTGERAELFSIDVADIGQLTDVEAAERVASDAIVAEAAVVSAKPHTFYQHHSDAAAAAKSMMRSPIFGEPSQPDRLFGSACRAFIQTK